MIVAKKVSFDAAHFLPSYPGKCANMHGHHWEVELGVEGQMGNDGMVIDFTILKSTLGDIVNELDHKLLNDIKGLSNPTAENLCCWIYGIVKVALHPQVVAWVKVWETEDSYALLSC